MTRRMFALLSACWPCLLALLPAAVALGFALVRGCSDAG